MARPLRINVENGWYHITSRGNRREAIFLDKRDHVKFLDLVGELGERYRVQVHGYVLMGNEERFIQNAARLTHLARTLIYARSILDKMSLNGAAWGGLSLWSLNGVFAAWGRRKDWA